MGLQPFFNIILINTFQSRFFGQFNDVLDDCSLYILLGITAYIWSFIEAVWSHFIPG
jgi:hypothetical protein